MVAIWRLPLSAAVAQKKGAAALANRAISLSVRRLDKPAAAKDAAKPSPVVPGIPYNKLTIGVPKEIWPKERRLVSSRKLNQGMVLNLNVLQSRSDARCDCDFDQAGLQCQVRVWCWS